MSLTTCILVHAPQGAAAPARWAGVADEVLRRLAPAHVAPVRDAAEAESAALQAALAGHGRLIALGGTAISHGLLNGVMRLAERHRRELKVGFLSLGRQPSWQRTLEQPSAWAAQLDMLAAGHTLPYDVGRADLLDGQGKSVTRHFLNGCSWGGALPRAATPAAQRKGRWARTVAAALRTAWRHPRGQTAEVALALDGQCVYRGALGLGWAMSGRYYPGLGHLAQEADPADGLLDLFWMPWGQPLAALGCLAHALPLGRLLPAPRWQRAAAISLAAGPDADGRVPPVPVEGDGIALGTLPLTLSVVPRTLPVIVQPVAVRLTLPRRVLAEELEGQGLVGSFKSAVGR
ncbi:MAG TPA: diacylglycerol kinase family protein [bacterium]|nr:diacylglycerol kinase family protein [bacterium]